MGRRLLHRQGQAFTAVFRGSASVPWLPGDEWRDGNPVAVTARVSAFTPVPRPIPQVLCLAVRLDTPTAPVDLTFFSSYPHGLRRAVFAMRSHAAGAFYSSAMSYRWVNPDRGTPKIRFGARTNADIARGRTASAELEAAARNPDFTLELVTAVGRQDWITVGWISDWAPLPEGQDVRYRPGDAPPGLDLTAVGRFRRRLYERLQR